ncbi:TIGR03663 family protein, partial [bacterium]|nr:TIGR03663 family protein [bacterium]
WLGGTASYADSTEATYRLVPVVFGAALVLLLLLVCDGLGRTEALWAAVFAATSPSLVYYSRYYIQETLLVFFTFLAIAAAWRYKRTRAVGWALVAGAALGLMHATKETCVIAYAAMAVGLVVKRILRATRDSATARPQGEKADDDEAPEPTGARPYVVWHFVAAAAVAVVVSVTLFSSFFTHAAGPLDSVRTYLTYLQRSGGERSHEAPWSYYLSMLLYAGGRTSPWWVAWGFGLVFALGVAAVVAATKRRGASIAHGHMAPRVIAVGVVGLAAAYAIVPSVQYYVEAFGHSRRVAPWWSEGLIVSLAVAGIAAAKTRCGVTRTHAPFVRFLAAYTVAMTAAYSLIRYKTPWNALSFVHGMVLLAGVGAAAVVRVLPTRPLKAAAALLLLAATYQYAWGSYRASYTLPTYRTNPYAYVHTSPDVVRLEQRLLDLARVHPDGSDMLIKVFADDPWPLPWYLRRFGRVGYWPAPTDDPAAPVVVAEQRWQETLGASLDATHQCQLYGIRTGVHLVVYIENGLWEAYVRTLAAPAPAPPPAR